MVTKLDAPVVAGTQMSDLNNVIIALAGVIVFLLFSFTAVIIYMRRGNKPNVSGLQEQG